MKISPSVLNRLEELDIITLDHRGDPIAFSKNFSIFIDSYMVEQEQSRELGDIIKEMVRNYTKGKLNKYENKKLYASIVAEILVFISQNSDSESCEEFRKQTLKRLHL